MVCAFARALLLCARARLLHLCAVTAICVLWLSVPCAGAAGVSAPRAPSGPPLLSGPQAAQGNQAAQGDQVEQASGSGTGGSTPVDEADPLVSNGLQSPLCQSSGTGEALPTSAMQDCRTSGFVAAPAPTENYAFDVHTETGSLEVEPEELLQKYVLAPVWMALVWVVHAVIVALQWCYTIDLLNSSAMGSVTQALRALADSFTQPWLAGALAVASVIALYHGIVRRRVAQTLGEALLMAAMMAAGLWVIVDPTGTVGSLGRWSNEVSLGVLGAADRGTPAGASRALAEGMAEVFSTTVEAPWCYMEFGNVQWCRDPALLDPRLRAAGLVIAGVQQARTECTLDSGPLALCARPGSGQARALSQSAQLLREASTNGGLFLALPADQPERNSVEDSGSLLHVLCGGDEADHCTGPTAAQAEFRTDTGTWPRVEGLLLIVAGAGGLMLLLGFIALRLLEAGIVALIYLLMAPVAVLAPAFGDGGRGAFRKWATRLLGAIASKLLYSLLLGVVLLATRILLGLQSLGWWVQWLMVSSLWWGAYRHRHQLFAFGGAGAGPQSVTGQLTARVGAGLRSTPRGLVRGASMAWGKLAAPPLSAERAGAWNAAVRAQASNRADEQARLSLRNEHARDGSPATSVSAQRAQLASARAQLQRVHLAQQGAQAKGEHRRAGKLDVRARRIEGEIGHHRDALDAAQGAEKAFARTGQPYTREQLQERSALLDAQAALPAAGERQGGEQRDYGALAPLAGYRPEEYRALHPTQQRNARLAIDRELALRKEMKGAAGDIAIGGASMLTRRERRHVERRYGRALDERLQSPGAKRPESPVMLDAQAVAQRRKRQLGWESRR